MGEAALAGRVTQILPAIQDGAISFQVTLDQRYDPRLRPNQRVDVQVATAHKDDVIRVKRAAFPAVNGRTVAFVVRGDRAVRTPVELGVASFDCLEILKGLAVGDEVILSDMADHAHLTEVEIR
jgi:HlyD family secretion protein